ncbi:MAG: restriction endonuclease subunit S [Acidaminococcaceae bacterium]|nr:restriction endonuclease subunit S [Acidaminococcaceae bacterium]
MSKLNQLIAELCPDGVEYKKLKDVATIERGVRVVRSQLSADGEYPVYQNSMTPLGYYHSYNCSAKIVYTLSAQKQ